MSDYKTLHVVRHAKSAWDDEGVADIDRSLKPKGIRNAYEISRRLKLQQFSPDKMVSSPANRALHTAVIFARAFDYPLKQLEVNKVFYESSVEKIMDYIRKTSDKHDSLMIFGHNPEFSDLVNVFTADTIDNIPTSGVVTLRFKTESWKNISSQCMEKQMSHFPNRDE
jgi:phosphohistidine phosphatase